MSLLVCVLIESGQSLSCAVVEDDQIHLAGRNDAEMDRASLRHITQKAVPVLHVVDREGMRLTQSQMPGRILGKRFAFGRFSAV